MNTKQQEEMNKRFDELRLKQATHCEDCEKAILSFIDQEVEMAVAEREKEIQVEIMKHLNGFFDWAEQVKGKEIGHWVMMYGASPSEFKKMILSLITKDTPTQPQDELLVDNNK